MSNSVVKCCFHCPQWLQTNSDKQLQTMNRRKRKEKKAASKHELEGDRLSPLLPYNLHQMHHCHQSAVPKSEWPLGFHW